MKIRQHKILTRALLILFIVNFALAAPAAVRERPDLDANVTTRDVTTGSQKRWDPLDEGGSTNVPEAGDAQPPVVPPPSLDSTGRVQRVPVALSAPTARPPSASPPGLWPPSAPPPRLLYPHPRPLAPILHGPRPLRLLLPAPLPAAQLPPLQPDPLPPSRQHRPYRLQPYRPRPYRPRPPRPRPAGAPPASAPPASAWPASAPRPPSNPASQPGPSEDRFPRPPGFSENSDASSSTGNQPSTGVEQETHSVPDSETLSLADFLRNRFKPRNFDSDAVPEGPKIIEISMGRESAMSIQDGNFD